MASNKNVATKEESLEKVESALGRGERFIEENQKILTIVVVGILAVVGIIMAYNRFYKKPLEEEARSQMFVAEQYFERDSFRLALNGDANYPGFLKVIDEYGSTKAGNLANYYAGICYIKMGKYDDAIGHLKEFSSNDRMIASLSSGLLGDAYMEKNQVDEAISFYKKAADKNPNNFSSPIFLMKLAEALELKGNNKEALDIYKKIKEDFPRSSEGRVIDKYITRAKLKQ
jgi:tetratricopeptide (TPR) repeat protein